MNAKSVVTALSLVFAGSAALAFEASDAPVPASTLTRAEVQAAIGAPSAIAHHGEVTVFADAPAVSRDRDTVRAEARDAKRAQVFDELQAG